MGVNYSVYKLPYISSAISVHTENLQTCLAKAKTTKDDQACITANVSAKLANSGFGSYPITYFGTGESVMTSNGETIITPASSLPNSNCLGSYPDTYFDTSDSVMTSNGKTTITPAYNLPNSNCLEKFNSSNDPSDINIESNKIFCFNGTFTILTIFVLILLLIFINVNTKNTVVQKSLL
jgi:hypothetical protein